MSQFVPALGRLGTRFYDPLVRATTRERRFKERLLDLAELEPGDRVLDLGCGTGTLAIEASHRQPGAVVTGLDADPSMLERARGKATGAGLDFQLGSATSLPFPDASFDIVLSTLFLHHLDRASKEAAAREARRVLAPGGRLLLADWGPPSDPLMRVLFLGIQLLDGFEPTRDNVEGRLPEILRAAGFAEVRERDRYRTMFGSLVVLEAEHAGC